MTVEPLIPLAQAVAAEAARLDIPVAVSIDQAGGVVVVDGEVLMRWGPRSLLEARLEKCGLQIETHMPHARIIVFPHQNGTA